MARSADPDGEAAWAAVAATVRPLGGKRWRLAAPPSPGPSPAARAPVAPPTQRAAVSGASDTLDGGWDRRLKRGAVSPDVVIDLHGHTLAAAHAALEAGLARAVAAQARIVLLVAGRMPREGSRLDSPLRGIIRASVGDWIAHSRHGGHVAALRPAHPRHGGAGALYLILRRRR